MAKKTQETLEDLAEMAATLPDDLLDDELHDACYSDARLALETIREAVTLEKLEFLYARGYTLGSLKRLINEAKKGGTS